MKRSLQPLQFNHVWKILPPNNSFSSFYWLAIVCSSGIQGDSVKDIFELFLSTASAGQADFLCVVSYSILSFSFLLPSFLLWDYTLLPSYQCFPSVSFTCPNPTCTHLEANILKSTTWRIYSINISECLLCKSSINFSHMLCLKEHIACNIYHICRAYHM